MTTSFKRELETLLRRGNKKTFISDIFCPVKSGQPIKKMLYYSMTSTKEKSQ